MKRKTSLPALSNKLWAIFSKFIRLEKADENGLVKCFSCDSVKHWKELDAGHYYAKSISLALRFDERNVHPQCTACNRFRHGNLVQYALALKEKYGDDILELLESEKHKTTKYSRFDYEEMIGKYQNKLLSLESKEKSNVIGAR